MAWIPANVRAAIEENDVGKIIFQDPLGDESRKAKRNLLIASFTCLLIAVLKLQVTGFLGLTAGTQALGNELAQGLACTVVIYMLVSYGFHVFVDYSGWKFERERTQTQPYLDLLFLFESSVRAMAEQIENAVRKIPPHNPAPKTIGEQDIERQTGSAAIQLANISKHLGELREESSPLLESWRGTVRGMSRLTWRLRARFALLWAMDILLPMFLAGFAIYKTYPATRTVALTLFP